MGQQALQDEILIVDLESTCWEFHPPPGEESDIIEIGVAHLDIQTLQTTKNWNVTVLPKRSKVSDFCTKLNGHTQKGLEMTGVSLTDAFDNLIAEKSKLRPWASWGNYDRNKIEADCKFFGIRNPMSVRHLNVKTLFAWSLGLEREVGMDRALEMIKQPLEGKHHSGKDDAKNIAKILGWMLASVRRARQNVEFLYFAAANCGMKEPPK